MSFQDVMNRILPPQDGLVAGVTNNSQGSRNDFWQPRERGLNQFNLHQGTDFNYAGLGQGGANLTHPSLYSPVSGTAEFVGGKYGTVAIRDQYGNLHQIMHLDEITINGMNLTQLTEMLNRGETVAVGAGDLIGTMGNTGAQDQHVHYQILDANSNPIDPELYHDNGGNGDTSGCLYPPEDIFGGIPILEQSVLDFDDAKDDFVTPIILDLDGDGVETIGVNAGAYFDHDGNGFAESTGWVGADDGLLVWDRNGDGRINDGKELFGNETILANGSKAPNGYAALGELDTNADGKVDVNDAAFASLKVWKDLDGDGYSAIGELFALTDVGVQSINTGATGSTYTDPNGNQHKLTGSFTRTDGTTGASADVWFQTDKLYTIQEEYLPVSAEIAALPDLRGYGNVYDLQQAMVRDTSGQLKTLVQGFIAETNPVNRDTLLEQILFKWTGSDGIDPASRGGGFDARKRSVLEKFYSRDAYDAFCDGYSAYTAHA